MLETTIKVSREFRNKISKAKRPRQSYQEYLEEVLSQNSPTFPFDNDYSFDDSHEVDKL